MTASSRQSSEASGRERIAAAFARAKDARRGALVPYICAGDPDAETTAGILEALGRAGADVVEVGIPYGDPLADGPTIAAAAQRALDGGATVASTLATMARAHGAGAPPMLAFTYVNPVIQLGVTPFADALVAAGACGAIVPDVPLEETGVLRDAFDERGLVLPLLVAPTTPAARADALARASGGFVYVVSRLGVTGAKSGPDFGWIAARVEGLRAVTDLPIAVGFGISTPEHVKRACTVADAAIVGSALIDAYAGTRGDEARRRSERFVRSLAAATGHAAA